MNGLRYGFRSIDRKQPNRQQLIQDRDPGGYTLRVRNVAGRANFPDTRKGKHDRRTISTAPRVPDLLQTFSNSESTASSRSSTNPESHNSRGELSVIGCCGAIQVDCQPPRPTEQAARSNWKTKHAKVAAGIHSQAALATLKQQGI